MKSLFIAGLILFTASIILIYFNYDEIKVYRNGSIVKMRIEKLPSSCIGAKVRYYVSFSYNGKIYDKATRGAFCDNHHVGEMIDIKWLKGSKSILWPHESALTNLISFGVLGLLGLTISAFQWKKIKCEN